MRDQLFIIKRDGSREEFNKEKIVNAVMKAMVECDQLNREAAEMISNNIESVIFSSDNEFKVEEIQDMIEIEMMQSGLSKAAKHFILYRNKRNEMRNKAWDMTDLQLDVIKNKYYYEDETFDQWIDRVSAGNNKLSKLMRDKKFLFAGRILSNRGLPDSVGLKVTYSNCYVIEAPEDNIESIYESASKLARTFSYGGGAGINIGKLRPKNSVVNNAAKSTTGAVSFMELYNMTTDIIAQKGRRGALMISMPVSHPDIDDFVNIKMDLNKINKANISLMIDDKFMNAVLNKEKYYCKFKVESTGEMLIKEIDAYNFFMKLCKNNWEMAEPGMLFWDRVTNYNFMSKDPEFELAGTNPCAEEPLPAGGSCLLGSINLGAFVNCSFTNKAYFDYPKFKEAVETAVVALDEVLDEGLPLHPLAEQRECVAKYRQIGLGVMGIADMLIRLGMVYGENESLELCDNLARLMLNTAIRQSALLAKEHGPFPAYSEKVLESPLFEQVEDEVFELVKQYGMRHSALLTIPPCGSISTLLGVSGGIEPVFAMSYTRKTQSIHNEDFYYKVYTPIANEYMRKFNLNDEDELPEYFIVAGEIPYENRIKMQSVWQKYIDASISSTINLPEETTVEEIAQIYIDAWKNGLKGITIYRDNCARSGVLVKTKKNNKKEKQDQPNQETKLNVDDELWAESKQVKGKCPNCGEPMAKTGGCDLCLNCGWSKCQ